jgi:hypothetical protein
MFRFYPIRFRKSGRKDMTFLLVGKIYATIFLSACHFSGISGIQNNRGFYKGRERWGYFKSLMMVKDKNGNGEKQ